MAFGAFDVREFVVRHMQIGDELEFLRLIAGSVVVGGLEVFAGELSKVMHIGRFHVVPEPMKKPRLSYWVTKSQRWKGKGEQK